MDVHCEQQASGRPGIFAEQASGRPYIQSNKIPIFLFKLSLTLDSADHRMQRYGVSTFHTFGDSTMANRPGGQLAIRDDIKAAVYVQTWAHRGHATWFQVVVYFSPYRNQAKRFETLEDAMVYARSAAEHNRLEILQQNP